MASLDTEERYTGAQLRQAGARFVPGLQNVLDRYNPARYVFADGSSWVNDDAAGGALARDPIGQQPSAWESIPFQFESSNLYQIGAESKAELRRPWSYLPPSSPPPWATWADATGRPVPRPSSIAVEQDGSAWTFAEDGATYGGAPGRAFVSVRLLSIDDATDLRQERRRAEQKAAAAEKAKAAAAQRGRTQAYDAAYAKALGNWTIDDETPTLIILLQGQELFGNNGPKLIQGPRRKAWEKEEGPIPWGAGQYVGPQGLMTDQKLATAGVFVVHGPNGWRPPTLIELYPYYNQIGQVAKDQTAAEQYGERWTRNRAQTTAVTTQSNRASLQQSTILGRARGSQSGGGIGAVVEKRVP